MKHTPHAAIAIVDGALGAKFINAVKQKLEDIELWKRLVPRLNAEESGKPG